MKTDETTRPVAGSAAPTVEVVKLERVEVAGMRRDLRVRERREWTRRTLPRVAAALRDVGAEPSGPAMSVLRARTDGTLEVTVGYPVRAVSPEPSLTVELLPEGGAVRAVHLGPYDSMMGTYDLLVEWLVGHHHEVGLLMWEEYLIGSDTTDNPALYQTRAVYPLSTVRAGSVLAASARPAPGDSR